MDVSPERVVLHKKSETASSNSYFSAWIPEGWKQEVRRGADSEVFQVSLKKITGSKIPVIIYLSFYPNNSEFLNYKDFIDSNSKNIFGKTSTPRDKYGPVEKITLNGGDARFQRYGDDFIREIKTYLDENPGIPVPDRQSFALPVNLTQKKTKGKTFEKTYDLFREGFSVEDIVKERNLTMSTITGHLEQLTRDGRDINIDRLVDPAKRGAIERLFMTLQTWSLSPVVEHFNGTVSFGEAKLVRACMQCKKH